MPAPNQPRTTSVPGVSIGIPVFNGEATIAAALDSLLAQTFTNSELIISDNASFDGTAEICRSFAARDAAPGMSGSRGTDAGSGNVFFCRIRRAVRTSWGRRWTTFGRRLSSRGTFASRPPTAG